jgi:hypothetical protein
MTTTLVTPIKTYTSSSSQNTSPAF